MKKISMALIALLLCITLAALAPAQVVAATKDSANQKYISEVRKYYNDIIVRTAKTEALAKSKITAEGHYILDQNLSAGAREVWETGGQYTYLGYTVTTDPKQAIRDIRVATFTPGGQIQFGELTYGCAGTLGFPATSKEENADYPQNLDGLFFTRQEKAGTPIEVGKLHIVGKFSDAKEGWEPVTTFSGLPYNFSTTRYNSQGGGAAKPGRWRVYPFEYTGYCTAKDHTWNETDRYIYYEPEKTYTSGTKYLSGLFFAFGTDSESTAALGREVEADFTELTDKLKTFPHITVRDDINLAKSYYYEGFWNDSNQKYLYLCYTWSYNPYRAIYGIAAFEGTIYSPNLPYTIQKAVSYQSTPSGSPDKTMSYASASVVVQRSVQHHWVVRGISPENAYMTTTGLIGQNTQVQKGYTDDPIGYFPNSQLRKKAFIPTGLYVSGYAANRNPLTLDDVVLTSKAYQASDNNGTLSVNVSEETTLGGSKAKGVFASVQDLQNPAETEPFNLAYPTWTNDGGTKYEAGTPLYLYFKNTVVRKKYISRIFVGESSRKDAKSDNSDVLEQADKQVDLNAIVAATAAGSDEVIPINVAADPDKEWYNRLNSNNTMELEPLKDQPAAYISVARTDKEEDAVRGIMLYKASPDKAVPNQMNVDGAAYYCASNTSPIRMSNGNSYYLYYSYNIGVSSGGPVTFIYASGEPFESGQTTALVTDKSDSSGQRAMLYGDTSMKTFIHAKYDKSEHIYFNKIYAASGSDENAAKLKLLEQGCTQYCDINLNREAGGSAVYFGYRTYMLNEKAIRLKNSAEEKEAERASQLSQAVYDIVCTVGEPFKPEGFISQKYQIYYAPVITVDMKDKTKTSGVNLNEGTTGPEIYMYYSSPYAAKEYNQRVKSDPKAILSSMPDVHFYSTLTKFAFTCYDRVPYNEKMEASTSDSENILRWEYVMQANSKSHIDLNEGAILFNSDYRASDNRVSMFAQREDGSVKPSAEITGGYVDDTEDLGYMKIVK